MNKAIMVVVNKWDLIEKDDKTLSNYQKKTYNKNLSLCHMLNTYSYQL